MALLDGNGTPSNMLDDANLYNFSPLYFHCGVYHGSADIHFVRLTIVSHESLRIPAISFPERNDQDMVRVGAYNSISL